jgi:hypothetical protein
MIIRAIFIRKHILYTGANRGSLHYAFASVGMTRRAVWSMGKRLPSFFIPLGGPLGH